MSNTLKVYKREISLDGTVVSSEDFLDAKGKPIELASYTFTSKRMGGAPSITASFMHPYDLKDEWTGNECVEFRGENFFISGTPSVSFDNTNVMYKHECTFVSERSVLDSVYFFDTVSGSNENDKPLLSSISFSFFGDINTLAYRLNKSLQASGLQVYDSGTGGITGYRVVVDSGISSKNKMLTFDSQYISNVLQTFHTEFGVKYYFDGKVVHIGEYQNEISEPLRYGSKSSLLSITKNNTKNKIITSITGVGSEDNIPYYYPNQTEKGNIVITTSDADIEVVNLQRFVQKVEEDDSIIYAQALIQEDSHAEMLLKASGFEDFKTVGRGDEITIPTKENEDNTAVNPYCDVTYEQGFEVIQRGFVSFDIERGNPENGVFKKVRLHRKRLSDDKLMDIIKVWDDLDIELLDGESFEIGFIEEGYYKVSFDYSYTSIAAPKNYKDSFNVSFSSDANWINASTRKIIEDLSLIGVKETGKNEVGAMFSYRVESYIQPQKNLMPPIYRNNNERFYHAINNKYDGFSFEHEYKKGKPIEHFQSFPDIKPTITKMMAYGQRIDMFEEFAFDEKDDDSTILNGDNLEYQHPYFFAKLRPLGFNLFDHAIDEDEMVISMTGGNCGACEFVIGVSNDSKQQNLVQTSEVGELLRDEDGDVICNRKTGHKFTAQEWQNDTTNKSVWIALKKDINTFGVIMPNRTQGLMPTTNDKFVILHIDLPQQYIDAAEKKLENELLKYMSENNVEKFNFSVKMSRIYLAENKDVLNALSENSKITLIYDGDISNISTSDVSSVPLYISSYTYKVSENEVLPEVSIDVSETLATTQNPIQKAVNAAKTEVMTKIEEQASSINAMQIDGLMQATSGGSYGRFVRKDVDDVVNGNITFNKNVGVDKNLEVGGNANIYGNANIEKSVNAKNIKATSNFTLGDFVNGLSGARFGVDENGISSLEVDYLKVRLKAAFEALTVQKTETIGGKIIISPAGSIKCINVLTKDELINDYGLTDLNNTRSNFYRCFFQSSQEGEVIENLFQIGDQAYCKSFNTTESRYYWRLVVGVGQNYIDLSDENGEKDSNGIDIPVVGDVICHLGNQSRLMFKRQNAIIISSVDDSSPSITLYQGINTFSLVGKDVISMGVDNGEAFFYVGGNSTASYLKYEQSQGLELKGALKVGSTYDGKPLDELGVLTEEEKNTIQNSLNSLQKQIDGSIDSYFYNYEPTTSNFPASSWNESDKKSHLNDTFTNIADGRSWRWSKDENGNYVWVEITDTATVKALALAASAQETADGKMKVFVEQPKAPYKVGDLWANGENAPLMRCIRNNENEGAFNESDWAVADDSHKYTDDTIKNARFGKYNLLRNTGFTGDYLSTQVKDKLLDEGASMFSDPYVHWEVENAEIQASEVSQSGYEIKLSSGRITQTLKQKTIAGEQYVVSFKAKAISNSCQITFNVGGVSEFININDEYQTYYAYFKCPIDGDTFTLFSNNDALLCELQLERGTVASSWGWSMWDNQSELAYYQSLQYLYDSIKNGHTEILGGLLLSDIIQCGDSTDLEEGEERKITAGMSGIYNEDSDVAFWAGGTLEQAILAVSKFTNDPNYQPTEDDWKTLANFVVTHGGNAFLRGYIYALGGVFKGTVYANGGEFNNVKAKNIKAEDSEFTGKVTATSGTIGGFDINGNKIKAPSGSFESTFIQFGEKRDDDVFGRIGYQTENLLTAGQVLAYKVNNFFKGRVNLIGEGESGIIGQRFDVEAPIYKEPFAFNGNGNGYLNGVIDGYRTGFVKYTLPSTGYSAPTYLHISNQGDYSWGNRLFVSSNEGSHKFVLPPILEVMTALCSNYGTPFSVRMTIVGHVSSEEGYNKTSHIYGRKAIGDEYSSYLTYPRLTNNNGGETTYVSLGVGDVLELMLVYDGTVEASINEYSYQAYILNFKS